MSQISTVEEARQALCDGELFQVAGRLIDPDAIVKARMSSGTPTFTLEDGSTVQHDEFERGDVGDLLWGALPSARREGMQSETLLPGYNRIFQVKQLADEVSLLNRDGQILTSYTTPNSQEYEDKSHNGEVLSVDYSRVYRLGQYWDVWAFDLDGTRLWQWDGRTHSDGTGVCVMPGGDILVHTWDLSSNGAAIHHFDQQGNVVSKNESTSTLWGDNGSPPQAPSSGLAGTKNLGSDGFVVFEENGDLERLPLDGSTTTTNSFGLNIPTNRHLGIEGGEVFYHAGNGAIESVPIDNINGSPTVHANVDSAYGIGGVRRVTQSRIVIAGDYHTGDADDGAIIYSRESGRVLHAFTDRTYWDAYTDKSVL